MKILLTILVCLTSAGARAADITDVQELMRIVDRMWRSDSSQAVMEMAVKTKRYERTMEMEAWSKGKDKSLVVIKAPKKDQGIATLKVGNNIWNYLPKINRVTKVPASMMSGSWMGSHFTNDDLVQENTYENDYSSAITFNGTRDGVAIYEVTSTPKPQAAVVWGKVVMEIEKQRLIPTRAFYYDEEGVKIRTMTFTSVEKHNGRFVPMVMELIPQDKPGESTVVTYRSIQFDLALSDNLFSLQSLQQQR